MDRRMLSSINAGDSNWDLADVVRGFCTSSSSSSTSFLNTSTTVATSTIENYENNICNASSQENPLACLASIQFEEEPTPFSFQSSMFQEKRNNNGGIEEILQESSMPFSAISTTTKTTTNSSSQVNAPSSSMFVASDLLLDEKDEEEELLIDQFENQDLLQPQTQIHSEKRRKTHKVINVFHMTKEDLTTDEWAWRRNGQKPVKCAPFPRTYYRCNSSKECYATKHVEQSPNDQRLYIVTYIEDHKHPPPTYTKPLLGRPRVRKKFIKGIEEEYLANSIPWAYTKTLLGRPRVRKNFFKGIEEEYLTDSSPYPISATVASHSHNQKETDVSGINMVFEQKEAEYNEEDDIFQGLADLGSL